MLCSVGSARVCGVRASSPCVAPIAAIPMSATPFAGLALSRTATTFLSLVWSASPRSHWFFLHDRGASAALRTHQRHADFVLQPGLACPALCRLSVPSRLPIEPQVVMHPFCDPAGGFTRIQVGAFHEMALGAYASDVKPWQGCALNGQRVAVGHVVPDGSVL